MLLAQLHHAELAPPHTHTTMWTMPHPTPPPPHALMDDIWAMRASSTLHLWEEVRYGRPPLLDVM